jgi:hypothetical protein
MKSLARNIEDTVARLRVRIARPLNRLMLGSLAGKVPVSVVGSIEESCDAPVVRQHLLQRRRVTHAEVVRYDFGQDFPAWFRREKAFDVKNVYLLRDVIVSPQSGMAWCDEGKMFQESVGSIRRLMDWGGVLHEPLRRPREHRGEISVACPDTGYFHWLLEVMPNVLDALRCWPDARILLGRRHAYVSEAAKMLFPFQCGEVSGPCRCDQLIVPACESFSGFVPPRSVSLLRQAFQPGRGERRCAGRRIYISRSGVAKRAVANEGELEKSLAGEGMQIVRMEKLSLAEQIRLLGEAELIVGLHGAGLANMVWARKPCRVVEIFPAGLRNDCFARLALTCGFRYDYACCETQARGWGRISVADVVRRVQNAQEAAA